MIRLIHMIAVSISILSLSACGGGNSGGGGGSAAKAWGVASTIDSAAGFAHQPQIGMDANGNAIAVWRQDDGAGNYDIWSNRYSAGAWGTAERIEHAPPDASDPQIGMDALGNAMVAWEQNDNIRSARYDAGIGWADPEIIDSAAGVAYDPQIALDANGNAIAVWSQQDIGTGIYDIWANRYSAGAWGTAELFENLLATDASDPQIGMDAMGDAMAIWVQGDNIGSARYVVGIGWKNKGIIDSAAGVAYNPQIALDANGNATVVWYQFDGTGNSDIWANRYSAGAWGTAEIINSATDFANDPQIAMDANGNAIAVWSQRDGTGDYNIWSTRYSAGAWGMVEHIDSAAGGDFNPQIALDANGNATVVWSHEDFGTGIYDIRSSRYSAGAWGMAERIDSAADFAYYPQIALDANGNAIVVWYQYDGTGSDIWANTYL